MSKKRSTKQIPFGNLNRRNGDLLALLNGIRQDIDTYFTDVAGNGKVHPGLDATVQDAITTSPDLTRDEGLTVKVVLPGLDMDRVEIVVIDDDLIVQIQHAYRGGGNTRVDNGASGEWILWRMALPPGSDVESIQAVREGNLLTVAVPMLNSAASETTTVPVRIQRPARVVPTPSMHPVSEVTT